MKTPALVKYGTAVRALPCRDAGRLSINGTESPRAGGRFKPSAGAPTYKHRHESRPDRAKLVRKQPHSPPCARRGGVPVYNQQVERIHIEYAPTDRAATQCRFSTVPSRSVSPFNLYYYTADFCQHSIDAKATQTLNIAPTDRKGFPFSRT